MTWLEKYYGPQAMRDLSPTIFAEGKKKAVVRVCSSRNLGYVLVEKNGQYNVTPHVPLHEGPAPVEKMHEMRRLVAK